VLWFPSERSRESFVPHHSTPRVPQTGRKWPLRCPERCRGFWAVATRQLWLIRSSRLFSSPRLCVTNQYRQGPQLLSGVPRILERRRSRHSHPEASQGRVREAAVACLHAFMLHSQLPWRKPSSRSQVRPYPRNAARTSCGYRVMDPNAAVRFTTICSGTPTSETGR
jgi:hypothetical protein